MFENILGHENEKSFLENSIKQNSISHSYLFSGEDGIGKLLVAKEFAKEILEVKSLDTCIDFKLIEKKEDKKNISVEQIREEIIEDV